MKERLKYEFRFDNLSRLASISEENDVLIWIFHIDKIPPHIGISSQGVFFSLKSNGKDLLETSPFQSIDENGVGDLMKIAISQGRKHKKDLEIGICGEHGGDPNSIKFCHSANISYVSASPHRIPIALVAAAQAAINQKSVTSK